MKKRGQVTIFIILGVIIVSVIVLFLIFGSEIVPKISVKKEVNPIPFLDSCMEDKIKETLGVISLQGGSVENSLYKTFKFSDEQISRDISYLCYTQNYYIPCINQEPLLIQHLKNEIKTDISEEVETCFDRLTLSLEKQNYVVDARYNEFDIELTKGKVIINIYGELVLTKSGETSKQEDFKIVTSSRFYDLALVVQEIVSQEAEYCNFEYLGYMNLYPQWKIDKFLTSDSTIIYTVEHKESKERFRFAIRGCVIPPGL